MKRPKTSNKKISWFSIASVFLLAIALAMGVTTSAKAAATGSFDRDTYFPSYGDTSDYDRAWISVTDSAGNTTGAQDTVTVTVKAAGTSHLAAFTLKETGTSSSIFTTSGGTQTVMYPVGTTSGYVEDLAGTHNFPALGASIVGLNLKDLTGDNAGVGGASDGALSVATGNTLELLYGGSTLDTAVVKTNSGSFSFTPSSISATFATDTTNIIVNLTDADENLNPVAKDVIGFADGLVTLSGNPATGTSRVQIEVLDQTTGTTLSIGGTSTVTRNLMLVETGESTGVFAASGRVFSTTASSVAATDFTGNLLVGSSSTSAYSGGVINLGSTDGSTPRASFRILEVTASGSLALIFNGSTTGATSYGTASLAYKATTSSTPDFSSYGSSSLSLSRVVAVGTRTCAFGDTADTAKLGTSAANMVKLIDGSNYCLVTIGTFTASNAHPTTGGSIGQIYTGGNGGSVTVSFTTFQLVGARSGDSLKMSYLDELTSGGVSGTTSGTLSYGVAGETGTLAVDSTTADINDRVTITVVDGNLNNSSASKESVGLSVATVGDNGTTTNNRGDRLTAKAYSTTSKSISLSHPDGFRIGTSTIRISSTDNTYVWTVPTSAGTFGDPTLGGSTTFSLGTQSVSTIPLVRGASAGADSFLSSASTSSFVATLDASDNTVEISPDGTRWVSIPIVETGANSSTFVGTIGFDYTAARLTTDTSLSITSVISDFTGTSTLTFTNPSITVLSDFIGTGSVVRISDGTTQEFAEVTSAGTSSLVVTKLSNSTAFDPDKTYVQVIGNDMMTQRLDTVSDVSFFRIGGYFGATYRIRYNDAAGASNAYLGGDTLAITTSNMGFTTYTGTLATDVTGTSGPDTYVVVTLVDQDLNTKTGDKQTTYEANASGSNLLDNEIGLGLPSGSSTGNAARGYKNGGTGKIVYASTLSSITSTSVNQSAAGNTIDFPLVESANNSGTFKGSFQLSSTTATTNGTGTTAGQNVLKVTNGDKVYVYYNDSPNATAADNSSNYQATSPISIVTSLGTLSLSKETAFLSGDAIVATVIDVDRNTSLTALDTLNTALKVTGSNYAVGTDLVLDLVENGVNSGTFLATIRTGTQTTGSDATTTDDNDGTVKAIQDGIATVIYTDTSPSSQSSTKNIALSAFNATLEFDADTYNLGTYALVTLADAEQNTSITSAQTLLSSVFIQTSSANSTKVRMVETAADTGTFKGSIQVASSGGTSEFSRIQAAEGDTLKITYIDEVNTTGSSRTVTDTATVGAAPATPTPTPTATPVTSPTPTPTVTPVTSPTPTPLTVGGIAGTVVDIATTAPIAGATISTDTGGYSATTDATGSYTITNVEAGNYTVTASATGYDSSSQPVTVVAGAVASANFALAPTRPTSPTPTVTPTPVCEPESISATGLTLKRKKSGTVTVTVNGDICDVVAGETVTATINAAGKKRISVSPTSASTDENGQAAFTITAKNKTGSARVTFKAGDVKKSITVKVRK